MGRSYVMPQHAALYVRQSQTEDGSMSMDIQLDACRDTAIRFGVEARYELCERPSTSGYKNRGRDRPQFLRLLEFIEAGEVDCVVTYKSDRLSRGGGPGWAPLINAVEAAGLDMNRFVLSPDGWLSEFEIGLRAAMDREESLKTSSRMQHVRAREAREGKPRVGCRAYGYEYSKVTKVMSISVAEADTVRECTRRVLDGESVYSVVRNLNDRRVSTASGGRWKTSTLLGVLRSPRLAGLRSHLGEVVAKGEWDAIISEDEHHRLLAVTANRQSHGSKRAARTFPLVGFLVCGRCGMPLRSIVSAAKESQRRRYVCKSGELGGCGGIQIKAEFVEDAVRDYVVGTIANPGLRDRLIGAVPAPDNTIQRDALAELQRIALARQRLTDLAVDGTITAGEVRRKTLELNHHAAQAERCLADLPGTRALSQLPLSAEELLTEWAARGIDYQRHLVGLLIDNITVNPAQRAGPGRLDPTRLAWALR